MKTTWYSASIVLAASLLAAALPAQAPGKGDMAPEFEIQRAFNGGPASAFEMKGQTVMMEIFATW